MPDASVSPSRLTAVADGTMEVMEGAIYFIVGILLMASALVAARGHRLRPRHRDRRGSPRCRHGRLDGLFLVFILVELLGAVRATVAERQLLAEPFLVVGMIASIKEIVVASLKAGSLEGEALEEAMLAIGVLGGVVLLLALASFLVRRKEREPTEG